MRSFQDAFETRKRSFIHLYWTGILKIDYSINSYWVYKTDDGYIFDDLNYDPRNN